MFGGLVSHAADLTGAWASDSKACEKIFVKRDGNFAIANDADLYGSGFVIEQNGIKGKTATCSIIARKEGGAVTHMVAKCVTESELVRNLNYPRLLAVIGLCGLANLAELSVDISNLSFISFALAQPTALTTSQSDALNARGACRG